MALYLENFGLGFMGESEESAMGLLAHVAREGKGIRGYYGLPYFNLHYGDVQMILRTKRREDGDGLETVELDTHAQGSAIWECCLSGINVDRKEGDALSRRVVIKRPDGSGMAVVTLVNADVLPSFLEGDTVKMQVVGFPELIRYFEDEDAYAEMQPSMEDGKKLLLSEGGIFPNGLLKNRDPDSPDFEADDHLDDIVNIRGTVKTFNYGKFTLNGESSDTFVFCNIDTDYGPLQLVHTIRQVEEKQRKNMKAGAVVDFYGLLSGDVAIYEYEKGVVRDAPHDMAALRYTFSGNDPERVRSILSADCVYLTEDGGTYTGPDAVIERLKGEQAARSKPYTVYFATVAEIMPGVGQLEYPAGTRCLILTSDEGEGYVSLVFIDVNEEGDVRRIVKSTEPRYLFQVDETPVKKDLLEGIELPKSVAEPMLLRARFHGLIDNTVKDEDILGDTERDATYRDNARRMLDAMPRNTGAERDRMLADLFGYLFAKAAELEFAQWHPTVGVRGIFGVKHFVHCTPEDALNGTIRSGFGVTKLKSLKRRWIRDADSIRISSSIRSASTTAGTTKT